MNIQLPEGVIDPIHEKWPQCIIKGRDVAVEQAKDIIMKTDGFLTDVTDLFGGNNKRWVESARDRLGLERLRVPDTENSDTSNWRIEHDQMESFRKKIGFVCTNYIHNTWASSCFVGGPYGWCSPEGKISYEHNIGKYPSLEEVYSDFTKIAEAFPFVELQCSLYNCEACEDGPKSPAVTLQVSNGKCTILDAPICLLHLCNGQDPIETFMAGFNSTSREQGLPEEWIDDYGNHFKPLIDEVLAEDHKK